MICLHPTTPSAPPQVGKHAVGSSCKLSLVFCSSMTAGTLREAFQQVTPSNAGQTLYTRCERETFVRFPQTKAILFTIRTYVRNLAWYAARPDECATLAEALRNLPEDLVSFRATAP